MPMPFSLGSQRFYLESVEWGSFGHWLRSEISFKLILRASVALCEPSLQPLILHPP